MFVRDLAAAAQPHGGGIPGLCAVALSEPVCDFLVATMLPGSLEPNHIMLAKAAGTLAVVPPAFPRPVPPPLQSAASAGSAGGVPSSVPREQKPRPSPKPAGAGGGKGSPRPPELLAASGRPLFSLTELSFPSLGEGGEFPLSAAPSATAGGPPSATAGGPPSAPVGLAPPATHALAPIAVAPGGAPPMAMQFEEV